MNLKKLLKKSTPQYIPIDQVVKLVKERGFNFGSGNPYNRLRYYTKMGLLPNMVRIKKDKNDKNPTGHYPIPAIERLIKIDELKKRGFSNQAIKEEFNKEELTITINKAARGILIKGGMAFVVVIVIITTLTQNSPLKPAAQLTPGVKYLETSGVAGVKKVQTGSWTLPTLIDSVFIIDNRVQKDSKIFITFKNSYSPATSYFIASIIPELGFELKLNSPSTQSVKFDYWII